MKILFSPGNLVRGLRVTHMYICSSAKGPDSDKVKCKALDISPSLTKRETKPLKILKIAIVVFIDHNSNRMPKGNIVQETIPLKVRIESQPTGTATHLTLWGPCNASVYV